MLRIAKYFKPYLWQILLSVVLLFVQVNADLALPDYLSRIVNNGIQAGGIESPLPSYMRQSTFTTSTSSSAPVTRPTWPLPTRPSPPPMPTTPRCWSRSLRWRQIRFTAWASWPPNRPPRWKRPWPKRSSPWE